MQVLAQLPLVAMQPAVVGHQLVLRRLGLCLILRRASPLVPELLHVLLQLVHIARRHVRLDLLPIRIDSLPGLVLPGIVVVQRLAVLGKRSRDSWSTCLP